MNCNKAERFIVARVDGELSESRSLRLDEHLRFCPECRRFSEQLQTLTARVRDVCEGVDEVADGATMDRIWEGVRIEAARELKAGEAGKRRRSRWKRLGRDDERVFLGLPELGMGVVSLLAGLFIGSWCFFSAYGFPGSWESSKKGPAVSSQKESVAKTRFKKTREGRQSWNYTGPGEHKMKQVASGGDGRKNEEKSRFAERSLVAEAFGDEAGLGMRLNLNGVYCEP